MIQVDSSLVDVTIDGSIAALRLDRPEKHNALSIEMVSALSDALAALHDDPPGGLLVTGAGPSTCAGADADILEDGDEETKSTFVSSVQRARALLRTYPRPTVMAGSGAVVGAGFALAMNCDFTVLGDETTFVYPEVGLGVYSTAIPKLLQHLFGAQTAKEVVLAADPVAPERALELGLVAEVVPEQTVERAARERLEDLLKNDADAYAKTKSLLLDVDLEGESVDW